MTANNINLVMQSISRHFKRNICAWRMKQCPYPYRTFQEGNNAKPDAITPKNDERFQPITGSVKPRYAGIGL